MGILSDNMMLSVDFGALKLLETVGTDDGWGLGGGVTLSEQFAHERYGLIFQVDHFEKDAKLFPGGGDNTTSPYSQTIFSLGVENTKIRDIFSWTDDNIPKGYTISSRRSFIGFGWNKYGNSVQVGGTDQGAPDEKFPIISFANETGLFGVHFLLDENAGFFIEPEISARVSADYVLSGSDENGIAPGSPQDIALKINVKFGWGGKFTNVADHGSNFDIATQHIGDAMEAAQRVVVSKQYDIPVSKNSDYLGDGATGGASQITEELPFLNLVQSILKAKGMANFVGNIYTSHESGGMTCWARLASRTALGVASLAVGNKAGGDSLKSDGASDMTMVVSGLVSISHLDAKLRLLIDGLIAATIQSAGFKEKYISDAGAKYMARVTLFPDPTDADMIKGVEVTLEPYNKELTGDGNASASVTIRQYIEGIPVYVMVHVDTHAIYPSNVVKRFQNVAGGEEPYTLTPTIMRTGVGVFSKTGILKLAAEIYTLQESAGIGVGAKGRLALDIPLKRSATGTDWSLVLGANILGERIFVRKGEDFWRAGVGGELGVNAQF